MKLARLTIHRYNLAVWDGEGWEIITRRPLQTPRIYKRRVGAPSARRCVRLMARIAESEAKQ